MGAIYWYNDDLRLSPYNLDAYIGLVRPLFKNVEKIKALQLIENAIKIDPSSGEDRSLSRKVKECYRLRISDKCI